MVCVFITTAPSIKLFAWGEGDSGGHVHVRENGAHHSRWEQSGLKSSAVQFTAFYLKDTGSSVHLSNIKKDSGGEDWTELDWTR